MSGAAIGFLVSQIWYGFYNYYYRPKRYLKEAYEELKKLGVNPDSIILTTVIDYIVHTIGDNRVKEYIERRYDLFNLLGSTLSAIILALLLGLFFVFKFDLKFDLIFVCIVVFLATILFFCFIAVVKENKYMLLLILKKQKGDLSGLPEDCFKSEEGKTV